jgi:prepilin-type processing-associated H-X9-DG protein
MLSTTRIDPAAGISLFALTVVALIQVLAFGITALRKTRTGRYVGRSRAIAGLLLGGVALLVMFAPSVLTIQRMAHSGPTDIPTRITCRSHLQQIGLAMQLYANENHGLYPPRFEDLLLTQEITSEVFICPATHDTKASGETPEIQAANLAKPGHCSYIYLGAGKKMNAPANLILAFEPPTNHQQAGMNVLFNDGHVDFILQPTAQKVAAELSAGQNPPPSLAQPTSSPR